MELCQAMEPMFKTIRLLSDWAREERDKRLDILLALHPADETLGQELRYFMKKSLKWQVAELQKKHPISLKGELLCENKLISYERAFKMLENDMYIAGIGQAVLKLLSFKAESGNRQRGIPLLQKFLDIFGNMRHVSLKMASHLTSHNFEILKIEIFSKLCKISTCNLKK